MADLTLPSNTLTPGADNNVNDITAANNAIRDYVNGTGWVNAARLASDSVETAKIADANVTDAKLASPNNSVYRTLLRTNSHLHSDAIAATWLLGGGMMGGNVLIASGSSYSGGSTSGVPAIIYLDTSDNTVGSLTRKLRVRATIGTNATAPGITLTFGLYPVTIAGAADQIAFTAGTVVAGSTAAIATPAANTFTTQTGSDISVPTTGAYVLGVVTSGALANNAIASLHVVLETRHV